MSKLIAGILGALSVLLAIVAVATRGWQTADNVNIGLFTVSTEVGGTTITADIELDDADDDVANKLRATRAFVIIGILTAAAGTGSTFAGMGMPVGAGLFALTAVVGLIATAIYASKSSFCIFMSPSALTHFCKTVFLSILFYLYGTITC
eukprot:TRINITY_DN12626_c2_g1_i1.p1 TRINITY_DN12626_c2_g1~~TRINITY_DN12626_c2_g1_i1.p1  ORF type:complete len:159 (+),score=20.03 TRINITY_DN12626_c2_g1_i1:28-477(+)